MIKIENLKKQFGDTCACDIPSFVVNDGDILGLVGNNGAGKTTLFRLLLDLLRADEGSVTYQIVPHPLPDSQAPLASTAADGGSRAAVSPYGEGHELLTINPAESEDWKQYVSAYIDEGFLIDFLTPEEYFSFLGKISNLSQDDINERLKQFERFAADEIFGQKKLIRNLSAGNKMKVGIISALLCRPRIVILDEPFNFLDPSSQLMLKHLLTDYARQTGNTIVISSHNLQHTVDISTRIALLEHGKIIRDLENKEGSAAAELEQYFNREEAASITQ